MESLETFLRAEMEPLQYVAFFATLLLFASLELVVARNRQAPRRRRRWPLNYGLTALNIVVLGALPVSGLVAADHARDHGLGLLNVLAVAPAVALVVGVLFRSFVSWAIHLALHKIPLCWRIHRVHHTDTYLDVSTTVRFHPVEFAISTPVLVLSVIAMGVSPVALMIYEVFDAAMAVFTHANVRLPRPVEHLARWILVTPDMHRVHHSSWQPETDSNYGATLSVWDRLFATYREKEPGALDTMQIGLSECQDERAASFLWNVLLPVKPTRIPSRSRDSAGSQSLHGQPELP